MRMGFVGFEKLSLLDYEDKVSAVLFTNYCNFSCPFCHNGLSLLRNHVEINFDEIMTYLTSRKGLLDAVVISGGEPTLMNDLVEKIKQIKDLGFLIKLDTNGTHPEVIKELISSSLVDYIAMDIKNSEEKYPLTTNTMDIDMNKIKESITLIMNSGIDYEFRTTLVNEFHTMEDMKEIAKLIKNAKRLFLQKFVSRETCFNKNLHPIDEDLANKFVSLLKKDIKEVKLRGY